MKRERILQGFAGLLGLAYLCLIYPLYTDLWHSKWLLEMHNGCEPMFLSWFIALGPFLLLAARKPSSHRSLIIFAGCHVNMPPTPTPLRSPGAARSILPPGARLREAGSAIS